jgi:hypothetical protein
LAPSGLKDAKDTGADNDALTSQKPIIGRTSNSAIGNNNSNVKTETKSPLSKEPLPSLLLPPSTIAAIKAETMGSNSNNNSKSHRNKNLQDDSMDELDLSGIVRNPHDEDGIGTFESSFGR